MYRLTALNFIFKLVILICSTKVSTSQCNSLQQETHTQTVRTRSNQLQNKLYKSKYSSICHKIFLILKRISEKYHKKIIPSQVSDPKQNLLAVTLTISKIMKNEINNEQLQVLIIHSTILQQTHLKGQKNGLNMILFRFIWFILSIISEQIHPVNYRSSENGERPQSLIIYRENFMLKWQIVINT